MKICTVANTLGGKHWGCFAVAVPYSTTQYRCVALWHSPANFIISIRKRENHAGIRGNGGIGQFR